MLSNEQIDKELDTKYRALKIFIQDTQAATWLVPTIKGRIR